MEIQSLLPLDYRINVFCPICKFEPLTIEYNIICQTCNKTNIMKEIKNQLKDFKYSLSPKKLIINAIKSKLENHNIEKIILTFSLIDEDRYNIAIKPKDENEVMTFEIEPKDITILKKIFVNKIRRTIKQPENFKAIIIQCDLIIEDFAIFLQDLKNEVTKYEY